MPRPARSGLQVAESSNRSGIELLDLTATPDQHQRFEILPPSMHLKPECKAGLEPDFGSPGLVVCELPDKEIGQHRLRSAETDETRSSRIEPPHGRPRDS